MAPPSFSALCPAGRRLPGYSGLVCDWSEEDVQAWLREEGLQDLVGVFAANNIDGAELSRLDKDTAAELGIGEARNTERKRGAQWDARIKPWK